ncbi:40S ribosomal protein S21 [Prototheca wickerhamii]|uniref:40S ribosomal protein S21 n=1 Tax=Prototheca wickerhamii TaxID=3111 RepID=A0AAD9INC4_PROWI|nr:40S ribosomal protein S21 [Prototheca wickerhamii]
MKNDAGEVVDLYVPRKCSWTNKLIPANDHGSVQINVAHLDENGVYNGSFSTFALQGKVRSRGMADSAIDHLWKQKQAEIAQ